MEDVLEAVLDAGAQHRRRVPTATLNMVLREATQWKSPPTQRGSLRKGRIYYATQVRSGQVQEGKRTGGGGEVVVQEEARRRGGGGGGGGGEGGGEEEEEAWG